MDDQDFYKDAAMSRTGNFQEYTRECKRSDTMGTRGLLAILVGLMAALYHPILYSTAIQWFDDPDYSHGFLVPFIAAYFAWERRHQVFATSPRPDHLGIVVIGVGLSILLAGILGAELYLQRVSLLLVLAGGVLLILGREALTVLLFPIGFLIFMIPLPAIVVNAIAFPLQVFAAKTATYCLDNFGIPVLREGNVIVLASTKLEVAEACSGIRSLQALMALGTVFAYFSQAVLWKRWVLVGLSIPIAIAANAVRVSGTGVLAHYWGPEVAQGFYHTFEGWVVFLVAVVFLVLAGFVLSRVGHHQPSSRWSSVPTSTSPRPFVLEQKPIGVAVIMLGCLLISVYALSQDEQIPKKQSLVTFPLNIADRWAGNELSLEKSVLKVLRLTEYIMRVYVPYSPAETEARSVSLTSSASVIVSQMPTSSLLSAAPVWLYVGYYGSQRTGATYHSPKNCLPGAGWQFVESNEVEVPVQDRHITVNQVVIQKGLDKQVILYWYHDRGRVIASEYWAKAYLLWDAAIKHRSDGALVRISVPVTTTVEGAQAHALLFLKDSWPLLLDFMPAG